MDLRIYAKNIELSDQVEKYVQRKFERLERHLRSMSDAKLELSRTSARSQADRIVAQMTLAAGGYTLRGQESGPNLYTAVDAVTDVMDRQIRRFKGKVYRTAQARKSARAGASALADEQVLMESEEEGDTEPLPELGRLVRTKGAPIKPMTVEEAILEMELLDHDFFLLFNAETDKYNVVYRRHDGNYVVIEPEPVVGRHTGLPLRDGETAQRRTCTSAAT